MGEPVRSAGRFFKAFRTCMSSTWKEADSLYHIPKSRFKDDRGASAGSSGQLDHRGPGSRGLYYRRFKHCLSSAWKASDTHYHIPKSRHGKVPEKQV